MKRVFRIILNFILVCLCAGCVGAPSEDPGIVTEETVKQVTKFIYSDTCIITKVNSAEQTINFQNLETGKRYTLSYDNLTFFTDKYDKGMTAAEIKSGAICDITFEREGKILKTLDISDEYFTINNIDTFKFYNNGTRMEYLGDKYDLDDNVVVCSGNDTISVMEIADNDIISAYGYDHTIYSIVLNKGHGYVSVINGDYFIDGFIEIGKDIRKITKDMILTVPEGEYNVTISKDGSSGVKSITVGRNQEVAIDASDIEIVKKYGKILFDTEPDDALIYIDNERIDDINKPVELECGIYEVMVRADGYSTISRMLSVGEGESTIKFTLDKLDDKDGDDDKDKTDTGSTAETGSSETIKNDNTTGEETTGSEENNENFKKVYIDAPTGAEVYVDGNYIGVVPVAFIKKTGTVVITLRQDGCQTRSYTINFEDTNEDSRYSFSELLKIEE